MKKIVIALLLAALLVSLVPLGASLAEDSYASVYSGNKYGVRLRVGPGTMYTSELTVPTGTTVTVLEQGTVWTRIQAGTTTGYMMSKFLVASGTSSGITVQKTATLMADNGYRTWLRTSPMGKRLGLYSDGVTVSVLTYGDDWSRVMIGSSIGYMMTQYLQFTPDPTPTPGPTYSPITKLEINYPYPLTGDTLSPIVTPSQATYSCVWELLKADGSVENVLSRATVYTVSASDLGKKVRLTITGTGQYAGQTFSYTSQPVTDSKVLSGVVIQNTTDSAHDAPVVNDVLKAVAVPSSAAVTYSWRVAGNEKGTASTYTVAAADVGKTIQVTVTATGGVYTGSATSLATEKVVSTAVISGVKLNNYSPIVGTTVSAVTVPAGLAVSYQWLLDDVPDSTGATYTATAFQIGKRISVRVTDASGKTVTSPYSLPIAQTLLSGVTLDTTTPALGEVVTCVVKPDEARKTAGCVAYQWYAGGKAIDGAISSSYTVPTDGIAKVNGENVNLLGSALYVVATGQGGFGGQVTSGRTSAITSTSPLKAVTLNIGTPVLGDTITASVTPTTANNASLTYVWYVDNMPLTTTTSRVYQLPIDYKYVGKRVSVGVMGSGAYSGTVYSAQTNAILSSAALTDMGIYNQTSGQEALYYQPKVGERLQADFEPGQCVSSGDDTNITYAWTVDGASIGTGRFLVVPQSAQGKVITLTATGKNHYTGKLVRSTPAVYKPSTILKMNLDYIAPVSGDLPITTISGTHYSGVVTWSPGVDQYLHFKSQTSYTATIVYTLESGYGLDDTSITITNSAQSITTAGNKVTIVFKDTAGQKVSVTSITGLTAPVIGGKPDTTVANTTQFTAAAVEWFEADGATPMTTSTFQAGKNYIAQITLTPVSGYTMVGSAFDASHKGATVCNLSGVNATLFKGAAAGDDTATVRATFTSAAVGAKVNVSADRTSIGVGSSAKQIVCTAYLTSFDGDQSALAWVWSVNNASSKSTAIDANGILTIGKDEPAGKTLVVTAKLDLSGSSYMNSVNITTTAEAADSTDINVYLSAAPKSVNVGSNAAFAAKVEGAADETVTWSIDSSLSTITANGVLMVSAKEKATEITVTATAVAKKDKPAQATIKVIYPDPDQPVTVAYTKTWDTVKGGDTVVFSAKATGRENGADVDPYAITFSVGGEGISCNNVGTGSCEITVGEKAKDGLEVLVVATFTSSVTGTSTSALHKFTVVNPTAPTLSLNPTDFALYPEETKKLTAVANDGSTVAWASSDNAIATVSADGVVTAIAKGTAVITATASSGVTAQSTVTVNSSSEVTITVNNTVVNTISVKAEGTVTATAILKGCSGTVKWNIANSAIATVDASGKITGVQEGSTTLTASVGTVVSGSVTVTVNPYVTINLPTGLTVGATGKATVTPHGYASTPTPTSWASSDENVAKINATTGDISPLAAGETTITVTMSNNETFSATLTVTPPGSITLTPTALNLNVKETGVITAKASDSSAIQSWVSDTPAVATVDNGTITAVSVGTAKITVTSATGLVATATVTVTEAGTVTLSVTDKSMKAGATQKATVTIAGLTNPSYAWQSTVPTVATVGVDGTITAIKEGKTNISVVVNGVASNIIEVTVVPWVSVKLNQSSITTAESATATAIMHGFNTDPAGAKTWSSSAATIATIDASSGAITPVAAGTASISLTIAGYSDTITPATLTVTTPTP